MNNCVGINGIIDSDEQYCPIITINLSNINTAGIEDNIPYIIVSGFSININWYDPVYNPNSEKSICSPILFGDNNNCLPYAGRDKPPYGTGDNPYILYALKDQEGNFFSDGPNYTPGVEDNDDGTWTNNIWKKLRGEPTPYQFYEEYYNGCDECVQKYLKTTCIYSEPSGLSNGVLKIKDKGLLRACSICLLAVSVCSSDGPERVHQKDSFGKWQYNNDCTVTITNKPDINPNPPIIPSPSNKLFDINSFNKIPSNYFRSIAINSANTWANFINIDSKVFSDIQSVRNNWNGIQLANYTQGNLGPTYLAICSLIDSFDIIDNDQNNIKFTSLSFDLGVNTFYLNNNKYKLSLQDWTNIIMHELGHALGIGFWDKNNVWLDGNKYRKTQEKYRILSGGPVNRTLIPIEDGGPRGSKGFHWEDNSRDENYPNSGGFEYPKIDDLMTSFVFPGALPPINLSLSYLLDQGYVSTNNFNINKLSLDNSNIPVSNTYLPIGFCGCNTLAFYKRPSSGCVDLKNNIVAIY
jgi:hypothetical protein